jgi:hypothetical protein
MMSASWGTRATTIRVHYSSVSVNAPGQSTPHPQHNSFMSIAAITPQQNVIKLRKSRFILYNSLRKLCASPNLFLGGGLPAFWWFLVELAVQLPGLLQRLYHPQHVSDALQLAYEVLKLCAYPLGAIV